MLQSSTTNESFVSSANSTLANTSSASSFQPLVDQNGAAISAFVATNQSAAQFEQDANSTPTVLIHNPIPIQFVPVSYATAIGAPAQFVQEYAANAITTQQPIAYDLAKAHPLFQQNQIPVVTATNENGEVQLLEVAQFAVNEHPTAFHIPDNQLATSTSPTTITPVGSQFVYTNSAATLNGIDASNIVHEFLPQMAVFLPTNSSTSSTGNQIKPSTSLQPGSSKSANSRAKSKEIDMDEDDEPKKKFISPFAPEATVPLPSQLDELGSMGTTVWRRNERERFRVRCVNEGYAKLRGSLPLTEYEKRLSKVDTLRLAILYIRHLELLCVNIHHDLECTCFLHFSADGSN
ncbi:BHLH domain-containing protein [Aphelenchoides bicaudatus]|nr:BHLH domain-containing protein [Aphelenchoides bicaudatus]